MIKPTYTCCNILTIEYHKFVFLVLVCILYLCSGSICVAQNNTDATFDIGLFNPTCSNYEVRLKPDKDIISKISNLQLTIKWPENSFDITDIQSDYYLEIQEPIVTTNGFNYAFFIAVPIYGVQINWKANEEHTILSFTHDQQGTGKVDVTIATDSWAVQNNAVAYVELFGLDRTGVIYHNALNSIAGECPTLAKLKVILQGAYNSTLGEMRTALNQANQLPHNQPYSVSPWNYSGTENVTSFTPDIVDWIIVELRDKLHPEIVKATRACLLSKNGDVVDLDNTNGIAFDIVEDDYYLVVKHRNHLPVMSAAPVTLSNELNVYDFTSISTLQQLELSPSGSGKYGMIGGNVKADNKLIYNNQNNDRAPILSLINIVSGTTNLNAIISGYYNEDTSLDGKVIYNNINNDRSIILANIITLTGSTNLNSVYTSTVP